jgi:hypothetical protein
MKDMKTNLDDSKAREEVLESMSKKLMTMEEKLRLLMVTHFY